MCSCEGCRAAWLMCSLEGPEWIEPSSALARLHRNWLHERIRQRLKNPFHYPKRYPNLEVLSDHLASLGISSSQIAHGGIWVVGGSGMVHRESQKPSIRNMSSPFFFCTNRSPIFLIPHTPLQKLKRSKRSPTEHVKSCVTCVLSEAADTDKPVLASGRSMSIVYFRLTIEPESFASSPTDLCPVKQVFHGHPLLKS